MIVYFITIAIIVVVLIYNIITIVRLRRENKRVSGYYSNLRTKLTTTESDNSNYKRCLHIIASVQKNGFYSYLNGKMIQNFQIKGNGSMTSSRKLNRDGKNVSRLSDNGIIYVSVGTRFYPFTLWIRDIDRIHFSSPDSSKALDKIIGTKFVEVNKIINQKFIQEINS